jgi:hypothetical protein
MRPALVKETGYELGEVKQTRQERDDQRARWVVGTALRSCSTILAETLQS